MADDIMLGKVQGKRRRGRQRTRWMDGVTKETDKLLQGLCQIAQERVCPWSPEVEDDLMAPNITSTRYQTRQLALRSVRGALFLGLISL